METDEPSSSIIIIFFTTNCSQPISGKVHTGCITSLNQKELGSNDQEEKKLGEVLMISLSTNDQHSLKSNAVITFIS